MYTLEDLDGEIIDGIYYEEELCPVRKNLNEAAFEIDEILQRVAVNLRNTSLVGAAILLNSTLGSGLVI